MSELTISAEVAEKQLDSLIDYYEIDLETDEKIQQTARQSACRKLIKAIRKGRLEIQIEEAIVIQTLRSGDKLTYTELGGKAKVEMGKQNSEHGKVYALLGSLSGVGFAGIQQLKGPDLTLAESLGILFLLA